jgi:hypothetical protein
VAGAGGLATCIGDAGRGGLGGVLAGLGRGDGALWVHVGELMPVGNMQRAEGERERVRAASSFSFHVSRPGSGQRGLGLDQGDSTGMATGLGRMGTALVTVTSIFLDFCPPGARRNAHKNSNFEFLKSFTLGCQHITQGFQRYFC